VAQATLAEAWRVAQHIVWVIEWPGAPVGGPVTVETWRAGGRYRLEILEATAPALIGAVLIFDGHTAWHGNRFEPVPPTSVAAPVLSPASDALMIITLLAATPSERATQEQAQLLHGPATKITLYFAGGDSLALWRDTETGLPARISFSVQGQTATLEARELEPLLDPPAGLFEGR
jgi:hypothetical protein